MMQLHRYVYRDVQIMYCKAHQSNTGHTFTLMDLIIHVLGLLWTSEYQEKTHTDTGSTCKLQKVFCVLPLRVP